jgi:ankyrin repeat/BTB/POZ domain-containing protein 1
MTKDGVDGTAVEDISADQIMTLDGEIAGDEFASDTINYQVLLGKIDDLLERLKLDA